MKNIDVSPYFASAAEEIEQTAKTHPDNLFKLEIEEALDALNAEYTTTDDLIEAVRKASQMLTVTKANLLHNEAFRKDYDAFPPTSWHSHEPLRAEESLQRGLAEKLYNVDPNKAEPHASILIGAGSNIIAARLIEKLRENKVPMTFVVQDENFSRLVNNHIDYEDMGAYSAFLFKRQEKLTNRMICIPSLEAPSPIERDEKKNAELARLNKPVAARSSSGEVLFTLTYFPTELDAQVDEIPYDEYLKLYFELCDQPDAWVRKANDFLIEKLNKANTVRFTNEDGTDVTMSLIHENGQHFTFANSQTQRNIPGSEVFSGVRLDGINGVIVSKGKFLASHDESKHIINLTRYFKDGLLVSFSAEQGAEYFQQFLDRDPQNYRVGELGIGTNPHLKRHVANTLFVEKVSMSFHTAHGNAYTMTDYLGTPVFMDNGNKSIDHWDITTMLGDMYLDDECVMKDGKFLAPELDVLNRGWNAVPVDQRPAQWKDYKGPFTSAGPA